jgi:uridine phosphorylase
MKSWQLFYYHNKASDFWLTNFEMETAGYYAMGRLLGHEMLSLNVVVVNRIQNKTVRDPEKAIDSLIKKVLERL